jgi:hypothetical protein
VRGCGILSPEAFIDPWTLMSAKLDSRFAKSSSGMSAKLKSEVPSRVLTKAGSIRASRLCMNFE